MSFERIAVYGLFIFFILAFYLYAKKDLWSLFGLLVISFGLNFFTALAGTLWFPYKVVMFPIIIFALQHSTIPLARKVLTPYYFVLAISVLTAYVTQPSVPGTTLLQGPMMRPIVQLYTYSSMAMMVPFIIWVINDEEKLQKSLTLYYRLSEIVIYLGIIHFIFIVLGRDFIPILRPGGEANPEAAFGIGNTSVNRIYGFSGEPKTLATFILPYIFISLYNYLEKNYNRSKIYHLSMLLLATLTMIYTFSSAILISSTLCIILIPYLFKHRIANNFVPFLSVLIFIVLLYNQTGKLFTQSDSQSQTYSEKEKSPNLMDILYERSFGRVEEEADERYESTALNHIFNETPAFLFTGYGLGMYNYHLPLPKHSRGVEPIDSGWVVILLDLGLLGLVIFLVIFSNLIRIRNFNKKYFNDPILNSYLIGAITGFLAHMGNNALYQIFLFTGLAIAAYNVLERKIYEPEEEVVEGVDRKWRMENGED
jgi:hypothetical protein